MAHARATGEVELGPFGALDQRWMIRCPTGALAVLLEELYAALRVRGPAATGTAHASYHLVPPDGGQPGKIARDHEVVASRPTLAATVHTLVWAINRQVLERSQRPLILHAAGAERDGRVLVLAAPSNAGKTTLVAGLAERGWGYLGDEALAIATDGTVEGYPKPLTVRQGSFAVLEHLRPVTPPGLDGVFTTQWQVPMTDRACSGGPLARLVLPRYDPDLEQPAVLHPLPATEAIARLVPCTYAPEHGRLGTDRVQRLATLVERFPALALTYRDGDAAGACVEHACQTLPN